MTGSKSAWRRRAQTPASWAKVRRWGFERTTAKSRSMGILTHYATGGEGDMHGKMRRVLESDGLFGVSSKPDSVRPSVPCLTHHIFFATRYFWLAVGGATGTVCTGRRPDRLSGVDLIPLVVHPPPVGAGAPVVLPRERPPHRINRIARTVATGGARPHARLQTDPAPGGRGGKTGVFG